jgi:hypothetical protein
MKPLVGYEWPEGRSKQIAFISQDHHIHEFCGYCQLGDVAEHYARIAS